MSLKDYEVLTKVGEGAYSVVLKVKRLSDQKIYALKKVRLNKLKEKEKRNALNEVRLLASIKHPNVIAYKEAFFDDESQCLCLVIEFANSGDLYQKIQYYQKKGTYMSESFVWGLIIQLARGLKCLHDLNIVHRDLKSANVFLTHDGKVKLGDMNVSKVAKGCLEHTQTGTPYYASPEVWKDVPYDSKSDLWSLGCVIYEATCLKPPFRADDMQGLYKKVIKGEYPPMPRTFSQDLHLIVSGLLQINPSSRLNCTQLLAHPAVLRHSNDIFEEETGCLLLQTINFPTKLTKFTEHLPKPNFEDSLPSSNKSFVLPKMGNKSAVLRDSSEPPPARVFQERENSEKSLHYLQKYRKMVLKENYGALRLPKVRYPFQKYSTEKNNKDKLNRDSTIVPRVKSEKISRKPSTNRSLVAAYRIIL
jgi:NIMA (never in mitosis gene a)-related kinase 1/4/5